MTIFQQSAGDEPMSSEPIVPLPAGSPGGVVTDAVRVIARAEAMGLIEVDEGHEFDRSDFDAALDAMLRAGIGRQRVGHDHVAANPGGALKVLHRIIEESPNPSTEWPAVTRVLGSGLVTDLTGISASSMGRYAAGERATPDPVAYRLHFLAMLIADLLGSYNHYGVRRWFDRPRRALGRRSPRETLEKGWTPDGPGARAVAELAQSLTGLGAT